MAAPITRQKFFQNCCKHVNKKKQKTTHMKFDLQKIVNAMGGS